MSRKPPTTDEVVKAIKDAMAGRGTVEFDGHFRYHVQLKLKTTAKFARKWMVDALTDPGQTELIMLHSHDTKYTARVTRTPSGDLSYYGALDERVAGLSLYLDRDGVPASSVDAVRNTNWVTMKSTLDKNVETLLRQEAEKRKQWDQEQAAEDAETEEIIGTELSLIRGMLTAAGVALNERSVNAWAQRIDKGEGKTARRARVAIEINAKQLVLLAKWLREQGVEPVAAPAPQKEGGS